jgi:hypothetical protein
MSRLVRASLAAVCFAAYAAGSLLDHSPFWKVALGVLGFAAFGFEVVRLSGQSRACP